MYLLRLLKETGGYLTNTEAKHHDFQHFVQEQNFRHRERKLYYFRFNAPTSSESVSLDDVNKMGDIMDYTNKYLSTPRVQDAILACAHVLARKKQRTLVDLIATSTPTDGPPDSRSQLTNESTLVPIVRLKRETTGDAYFQTRPLLDDKGSTNFVTTRFLNLMGITNDDLEVVEPNTSQLNRQSETDGKRRTIKLVVVTFSQGGCRPNEQAAVFEVLEAHQNDDVVGDVILGTTLMGGELGAS